MDWFLNSSLVGTGATLATTLVRGDVAMCTVTPDDGEELGTDLSASLTISNTAPTVTTVQILPANPTLGSSLTCLWSGFSDPDGDSDASTVSWTVNGVSAGTGTELSGGGVGGDEITCTVIPSDGTDTGIAVSETVTIENTLPVLGSVTVSPSDPDAGDTLTCTPGTTTDADGTTSFTYGYAWEVNGVDVSESGTTLIEAFVRDDSVTCTVTPNDGLDDGDPVTSDAVLVVNGLPEAQVALSPTAPGTEETLTAEVSTSDVDGDGVSVSYVWSVDGVEVSGETDATLDGALYFDKDQTVQVTVTPNDGLDTGEVASSAVSVANTPPYAPSVQIAPDDPAAGSENLVCEITEESVDLDGDAVSYTASWTVDGDVWTGTTVTTSWTDDTVPGTETVEDEVWECTMTPEDGDDDGDQGTDDVTITPGGCTDFPTSFDSPDGHFSYCNTQGAWMADPLETLGSGLVWSMCGYDSTNTMYEYSSLSAFSSGSTSRSISLPSDWHGTGAVVWDGYVYYNRANSQEVVKVNLTSASTEATLTLSDAGDTNDCAWQWGGYSDIDFEIDELGLWIVWGDHSNSCQIMLTRVDEDLNELATYNTGAGSRGSYGNAFMVDGVLYVTESYSSSTTTINFAYDTCTETSWNPGITWYNTWGYNSMVTYNPNDQLIYSWDSSVINTMDVNF